MNEQEGSRKLLQAIIADQAVKIRQLEQALRISDEQNVLKDRLLEAYRNREVQNADQLCEQAESDL